MALERLTSFDEKTNASYHGDPNGTYIMAEDINLIQDTINEIESIIGVHSNKKTLSDRIDEISNTSALKASSIVFYEGNPLVSKNSFDECVQSFSYLDKLILKEQSSNEFNDFVSEINKRDTAVYGLVECDSLKSLAIIQLEIERWRQRGAIGVLLSKFDFEDGNTRDRQNEILMAARERNMKIILTGDYHYLLNNNEHASNPQWMPLNFEKEDSFYIENLFFQNGIKKNYADVLTQSKELSDIKNNFGLSIYVNDLSNSSKEENQIKYEHGHALSILFGFDAYYLNRTDKHAFNDVVTKYSWAPFLGSSELSKIELIETATDIRRKFSFGEIIYLKSSNSIIFTGMTIPSFLIEWKDNSIDGSVIKNGSIEDAKIKEYNGNRLVNSINKSTTTEKIKLSQMENILLDNLDGYLSVDALKANVIEAINARIENLEVGSAVINSAIIGDLTVDHIKANVIEAINISAGHIEAGSAYIHGAVIDNLDAAVIRSGDISTERMTAGVIDAININAGNAFIQSAVIGELQADRIQAEVINAINMYAESAVINKAVIDSAAIGSLTANHIKSSVIEAIHANIGTALIDSAIIGDIKAEKITASIIEALEANIGIATINNALIGELEVSHLKGKVIEAINASIEQATIQGAKISNASITNAHIINGSIDNAKIQDASIDTAKIQLGSITSALIAESQISTAHIQDAAITDALIANLSASKINAGTINSSRVTIQGDKGHLRLTGNRLQVFDSSPVPIERVSIGDVNNDSSIFGFRVRGADGLTVLYDEKGVYNEGITDGAITNPKIGDDAIDGRVIQAESILAEHIIADQILAQHISTNSISTRHILAGSITAESGIIANLAIGTANIANSAISSAKIANLAVTDAHIATLNADKITAGKIKAEFVEIGSSTTYATGYNPKTIETGIRSDLRLTTSLPTNISLSSQGIKATTTGDNTKFAILDHRGLYISNGAILIDGGLSKDNINDEAVNQWDSAAKFANNMLDDNVLTVSEKSLLNREWLNWKSENATLTNSANFYWPSGTTQPTEKTSYVTHYNNLNNFLNVQKDLNNELPILNSGNLKKESLLDGANLNSLIQLFNDARNKLNQKIATTIKEMNDKTQADISDLENVASYSIEVLSSNGMVFKNGDINTVLEARVFSKGEEVTSQFKDSNFKWTRVSMNAADDLKWNKANEAGSRKITITINDVYMRATFNCELID